jgi:hypothetical protein
MRVNIIGRLIYMATTREGIYVLNSSRVMDCMWCENFVFQDTESNLVVSIHIARGSVINS